MAIINKPAGARLQLAYGKGLTGFSVGKIRTDVSGQEAADFMAAIGGLQNNVPMQAFLVVSETLEEDE
ncbi:MAG: hypothetical protein FWE82_05305 [Defluviitaleaceae bacterium]|nr:hypothetical protein [Defluviitaleaceae bacterium]